MNFKHTSDLFGNVWISIPLKKLIIFYHTAIRCMYVEIVCMARENVWHLQTRYDTFWHMRTNLQIVQDFNVNVWSKSTLRFLCEYMNFQTHLYVGMVCMDVRAWRDVLRCQENCLTPSDTREPIYKLIKILTRMYEVEAHWRFFYVNDIR